jgi:predicted metal-binding transcription factor (methanogenesis marker protein 9)
MATEFAAYATKEITPTQEAFADWILEVVFEGNLPKGLNAESFRRSVALGGSLRSQFQKSDWWKNDDRNYLRNVEANRAEKSAERAVKAKEQAAKAVARAAKLEKDAADAVAAAKAKAAELAAKAKAA